MAVTVLLLLAASIRGEAATSSDRIEVTGEALELVFSPAAAAPLVWRACHPSCAAADAASGTSLRFAVTVRAGVLDASGKADVGLSRATTTADVVDTPGGRAVTFTSGPIDGVRLATTFEVPRRGDEVTVALRVVGASADRFMAGRRLALDLETAPRWSPPRTTGWVALGDDVRRVWLGADGVRRLGEDARRPVPLGARQWLGFRDRFWTLLARGPDGASAELARGPLALRLESAPGASTASYTVYAGPLEYRTLGRADPALRSLLFSGLWWWLRALSVGALLLLDGLTAIVGRPGPAIILLAVAVKLLLLPVTAIAHHLQAQVDEARGRLQPQIDAIKAGYRGEEQARRLMDLYRRERVHPLYTLKSLTGVLIQLPVFIAVFDMLAENFALHGASFLAIRDLSRPDGLIPLPGALPWLGQRLNLLPFVMSGVSLTAAARYDAAALTPSLVRRQRRNLGAMAILFFALFYAFPAGMVLYWTSTNALQLAVRETSRWRQRRNGAGVDVR
jgi:YidC/Oxa1 family membrane protein insertase